jgi:DNA repair protein RecO (recombination protein O)
MTSGRCAASAILWTTDQPMSDRIKVFLEPAWVLHQYPYRDSSLLLEVFSRAYGRVGLVARGARSARGRWRNQLQILRPLLLSWSMRGELGTLTDAEGAQAPLNWSGRQVLCASYLNELLLRLLSRHDPYPALFDAYQQALARLVEHEELALRCFEKRLLTELGYGLLLDHDVQRGLLRVPAGARPGAPRAAGGRGDLPARDQPAGTAQRATG